MSTTTSVLSQPPTRPLARRKPLARLAAVAGTALLAVGSTLSAAPVAQAAPAAPATAVVATRVPSGAAVLNVAKRYKGAPYRWGATGPRAFDCSGYTQYVYRQLGVYLPRTAAQQRNATRRISRANVRPGDLVFVHTNRGVTHVAIYAGNNRWWEASRPGRPLNLNRAWTSSVSYGRVG